MSIATETKQEQEGTPVALAGIVLIAVYLVALMAFSFYTIVVLWPGEAAVVTAISSEDEPSLDAAEDAAAANGSKPIQYLFWQIPRDGEIPLFFLVLAASVLGGLIHAVRSFYWYIGHQTLFTRWVAMYLLLPLVSGSLGVLFYVVVRGGLYSPSVGPTELNPVGFTALGGLVGLFSDQAVLKLKDVADTLFSKPKPGDDPQPQDSDPNNP